MKRLFLLRHAKAGYGPSDQTRPLNHRGKRDAFWLGQYLCERNLLPDHVLCSSAKRTMETYDRLQDGVDGLPPVYFQSDLYLATADHILRQLQNLDTDITAPMILCHNPGISQLFQQLVHRPPQDHRTLKYPTCCLGIIDFDIENWSELKNDTGKVFKVVIPSDRISASENTGTL